MEEDLILAQMNPKTPAMSPEDALLKEMEAAGVDVGGASEELSKEESDALKQQHLDLNTKMKELESKRQVQAGVSTAADVAVGIGTGIRSIVQNVYNGAVDLADKVENYAASKGLGT